MDNITYTTLRDFGVTEKSTAELNNLLLQLSPTSTPKTVDYFQQMLHQPALTTLLALVDNHIVGMLSAVISINPFKTKMYLEDLVVAEDFRGKGIAKTLLEKSIALGEKLHVSNIDLSSNSSRTDAIALYESVGFQKRDTNVFRFIIH